MDANQIFAKVQDLSDVELAFLICVIAKQHCLIQTNEESLDELEEELQLVLIWVSCSSLSRANWMIDCCEHIQFTSNSSKVLKYNNAR
jgi:hypothetical protein